MKIAFIGLGIMGSRMAANLAKNKLDLSVYNRTAKEIEAFQSSNVKIADSALSAVEDADIVFSMLSTPQVIESLFFGENGLLQGMKENAIWADCSTVNPSFSLREEKEAKHYNIRFLDSPVSGSKMAAQNVELVFLIGGNENTLKEISPYLDMMSNKTLRIGETGKGASYKMIINMMIAQSIVILSEAVLLGEKMGISKEFLLDAIPNSVVGSPVIKLKAQSIKNDDYETHFPLEFMLKDLNLADITAQENGQSLYLPNLAKELYAEASNSGMERMDSSAIYKYLEQKK
jgi:3-hydroxyisobutyrate dehydrogenase-like beta-hydroxyacid dehydrogenase